VRVLGVPRYLREKGKEGRLIRVARFRLGSEMRGGRYWEEEERRKCRIYGWAEETWEYVVEVCMREEAEGKGGNIRNFRGRGEGWMKRLQRKRDEARRVGGEGGKETEDERTIDEYEREREKE